MFHNPETDKVFLSVDVTIWLEWNGRISGLEDMELLEQLETLGNLQSFPR
jgi:hypothetical protein